MEDDDQKGRIKDFFTNKGTIGDMKDEDFAYVAELGAGNGGVVNKVMHKPTGIIMARKVSSFKDQFRLQNY